MREAPYCSELLLLETAEFAWSWVTGTGAEVFHGGDDDEDETDDHYGAEDCEDDITGSRIIPFCLTCAVGHDVVVDNVIHGGIISHL